MEQASAKHRDHINYSFIRFLNNNRERMSMDYELKNHFLLIVSPSPSHAREAHHESERMNRKKRGETQNIVCLMYFRKQVVHCFEIAQNAIVRSLFVCHLNKLNFNENGKIVFFLFSFYAFYTAIAIMRSKQEAFRELCLENEVEMMQNRTFQVHKRFKGGGENS